jgi:hypothetical protein
MITFAVAYSLLAACFFARITHVNRRCRITDRSSASMSGIGKEERPRETSCGDTAAMEAKLAAKQSAARHVRRGANVAGASGLVFGFGMAFPAACWHIYLGEPFGHVGVLMVILGTVGLIAAVDPTMPRIIRAAMRLIVLLIFPSLFAVFAAASAFIVPLPPLGFCSTRHPACALLGRMGLVFTTMCAVAYAVAGVALLPTMYAKAEQALPVRELLSTQRALIREDGYHHQRAMRGDAAYLLEGAAYFAMPLHDAIERLFIVLQALGLLFGTLMVSVTLFMDAVMPAAAQLDDFTWYGVFPTGLAWFLFPIFLRNSARRRVLSWLGQLGSRSETRQAVAFAALLGKLSPQKALSIARATFRGLPFERLTAEDLSSNKDTGLNTRTIRLKLGKCDALRQSFVSASHTLTQSSHGRTADTAAKCKASPILTSMSTRVAACLQVWHDDPAAKWITLVAWADRFKTSNKGRAPILWLDKGCIE